VSFLLDTNVVSEVRRRSPDPGVAAWWDGVSASSLYLSALTVGEIQRGITLIRARGDGSQADRLQGWLDELTRQFADRVLAVDAAIAVEWGRQDRAHQVPVVDGLLAATAKVHDLTVITRNTRDLAATGARLHNPFSEGKRVSR
jgi:predicted nucleic acid-binding protein